MTLTFRACAFDRLKESGDMKLKSIVAAAFAIGFGAAISAGAAVAQTGNASGPLVNGEWLEKNLNNPKVRIVEVSVDPGVFERGHIPGAQNIVWHTDLVDTVRATSPRRRNSRNWCASSASTRTPPSCSTATTTTGSRPGAPGCSTSTASTTSSCSTAAARSGKPTSARWTTRVASRPAGKLDGLRRQQQAARPSCRRPRGVRQQECDARRYPLGG